MSPLIGECSNAIQQIPAFHMPVCESLTRRFAQTIPGAHSHLTYQNEAGSQLQIVGITTQHNFMVKYLKQ